MSKPNNDLEREAFIGLFTSVLTTTMYHHMALTAAINNNTADARAKLEDASRTIDTSLEGLKNLLEAMKRDA